MQNAYTRKKKVEKINTLSHTSLKMKDSGDEKTVSYPLRLPDTLDKSLASAAKKTGMTKAAFTKLCLEIGIEHMSRCKFSIPAAILDASGKMTAQSQSETHPIAPLECLPSGKSARKQSNG